MNIPTNINTNIEKINSTVVILTGFLNEKPLANLRQDMQMIGKWARV